MPETAMVLPRFLVTLVLLLLSVPAGAESVSEDPMERQMLEIAKQLRCAVCQNQPVSESNSGLAQDMRDIIREKLQAGESSQQIVDYFVQRYGDYVLMKPSYGGRGTVLWLMPLIVFLGVAGFGFMYLRSRQQHSPTPAPQLTDEDRARIRAARANDNPNESD